MNVSRIGAHPWVICALLTVTFTGSMASSSSASAAPPATLPPPGFQQQGDFVPLSWSALDPVTQYTLPDGTLVTHVGGRTRDRHAREVPPVPMTGDPYDLFAAHDFERRSHDLTIYENVSPTNPAARVITIHPYTDMLLHDMGPELADNFPQGNASGQEWRTAPLWGLGLLSSINPNVRYLHDGRARSIEEAILWHAGQGAPSRDRFKQLSADDRQSLIDFVNSR